MKRQGRHSETMRIRADIVRLLGNSVDKDENALTQTQSRHNSGVNNIVPTHIMLFSTDSTASSPSVSSSCRFYGQQHVHSVRIQLMPFLWPTTRSFRPYPAHAVFMANNTFIPSVSSSCRFYGQQHVHSVRIQLMPFLWPTTRPFRPYPAHAVFMANNTFSPSVSSSCRFYGQQHVQSVRIQLMPFLWPTTCSVRPYPSHAVFMANDTFK